MGKGHTTKRDPWIFSPVFPSIPPQILICPQTYKCKKRTWYYGRS